MKSLKQIVIAHYALPPAVGGVESVIGPQAELFAEKGFLVTLLAGEGNIDGNNIQTSIVHDLSPNSTHIRNLQRILKSGSLPESYELRLSNLQKRIETEIGNIDTVIIHNMMTMPFNLTATEAFWNYMEQNRQKHFYVWVHDLAWLMGEHKNYLYNRRPWTLLKKTLPQVTYITVSEFRRRQMAELMNIPRRKIIVIPNTIKYQDFLRFSKVTDHVLNHLSIFHRYPVILLPVRQIPRKNIERSLRIIKTLSATHPEMLGIITGFPVRENGELSAYSRLVSDMVEELGLQSNVVFLSQVFKELGIADEHNRVVVHDLYFVCHLVLYLSLDEGFGMPILEAGAARTPIVLSQIPVFREIANNGAPYLPLDESPEYNANRLVRFLKENQSHSDFLFKRIFSQYNWDDLWETHLKQLFSNR